MKKKNGFTLVELLAVIVILALVTSFASRAMIKTINNSRANTFIDAYRLVMKKVSLCDAEDIDFTDTEECEYDINNDYSLSISGDEDTGIYTITLEPNPQSTSNRFKQLNLTKYGDAASNGQCNTAAIGAGATDCEEQKIEGSYEK